MSAASLLFVALVAQAAQPPAVQLLADPAAKAKGQTLLAEGTALYDRGDIASALERFQQAYAEYPSPKLLFNIGQASVGVGKLDEAMAAFERFLDQSPDAPADLTDEATESIDDLKKQVGQLVISCATPGVEIDVDGKKVDFVPPSLSMWVMPGQHHVTARHPDAPPVVEDPEIAAGSVCTLVVQLRLRPPVAKAPPGAGLVPSPQAAAASLAVVPPAPEARGGWLGRKWAWVAAGGTVAFAAGAVAVGLATQSRFDSLKKSCGNTSPEHLGCGQNDIDGVITLRNTTNVLWGLAGAAGLTAGILFFVEDRPVSVTPMTGAATGVLAETAF